MKIGTSFFPIFCRFLRFPAALTSILIDFGLQNRPRPGLYSEENLVQGVPGSSWGCCFAFLSLLAPSWNPFGSILGPSWADFGSQNGSQIGLWTDSDRLRDRLLGWVSRKRVPSTKSWAGARRENGEQLVKNMKSHSNLPPRKKL